MLWLALVLSASGASGEIVLPVAQRAPIAVVLNTPTGRAARTSRSEVIRIADELLKKHTDFFAQPVDEAVVRECKGRLTCLALTARRDYKRESLLDVSGEPRPFDVHRDRVRERDQIVPEYLLMISNVAGGDRGDRMSVLLMDLDRALSLFHSHPRRGGWEDEVEIAISERAVLASPPPFLVDDEVGARDFLWRAFDRHFAGKLAEARHWEPYGSVEIDIEPSGTSVDVDGVAVGLVDGRRLRLELVSPGRRTLRFSRVGYEPKEVQVDVPPRASVTLDISLEREAEASLAPRSLVAYAGLALAAIGAGIAVYGLASHDGAVRTNCFAGDAGCASSQRFVSLGFDGSANGRTDPINPSGVLVLPLGYSLAGAGLGASASAWWLIDDDETPWLPIVIGVVIGAASYGLSAAL